MEDYIEHLVIKVGHTKQIQSQIYSYKHTPIVYGASKKFTANSDTSAPINANGIIRVQKYLVALLYYGCTVDNKLIVTLRAIGSQQAAAVVDTAATVDQLLDYIAT